MKSVKGIAIMLEGKQSSTRFTLKENTLQTYFEWNCCLVIRWDLIKSTIVRWHLILYTSHSITRGVLKRSGLFYSEGWNPRGVLQSCWRPAGRPGGRRRPILHVTRKLNQFFSYGYEIWHAHSSPQNTGLKVIWWLYSKNWAQKRVKSPFLDRFRCNAKTQQIFKLKP